MATKANKSVHTSITGRVVATRYLRTSSVGNSSYSVAIVDAQGYGEIYDTAANSSLNYSIRNPEYRDNPHTFERNARGQLTRVLRSDDE